MYIQTILIQNNQKDAWNALALSEPAFSLMQSWEWGEYKEKLGWQVFRVAVEHGGRLIAGAQMLIKPIPLGLASVSYIPRGPIGQWEDELVFSKLFGEINSIAKAHNAIFLKVEPDVCPNKEVESLFNRNQFCRSQLPSQPLATIILDISQDENTILQEMRKSTRRKIFTAERKGVKIVKGGEEQLEVFFKLMKTTAQRADFLPKSFEYYKNEWKMFDRCNRAGFFLAYFENIPLAAHIAYSFGPHAAFFHQASSNECPNLNANSLLVWEEVKWAKKMGCTSYDLWGIPNEIDEHNSFEDESTDPERIDGLWGVYKFKRGFSKNIVRYCGSYDRVFLPLLYNSVMNETFYNGFEKAQMWLNQNLLDHFRIGPR